MTADQLPTETARPRFGPILSMGSGRGPVAARHRHGGGSRAFPRGGAYLAVGNPIKMSDSVSEVKRSLLLGEHTEEILREVGFDPAKAAEYIASPTLGGATRSAAE
jgi:formyl-CoA transferase